MAPRRRDLARLRREQGCLGDAVAYLLNLHPQHVPFFPRPRAGWVRRLRRFFWRRGYRVRWVLCTRVPRHGRHIVVGDSLVSDRYSHAVVYSAGRMVYDPQHPSRWRNDRITHRLIVKRVRPRA